MESKLIFSCFITLSTVTTQSAWRGFRLTAAAHFITTMFIPFMAGVRPLPPSSQYNSNTSVLLEYEVSFLQIHPHDLWMLTMGKTHAPFK